MAIALTLASAVAARARRRELAVFRTLGAVGRQLRATLRWQALTVLGVGLVLGIPFGIVGGRIAYRAFATGLGVRPEPLVPLLWTLVLALATIGMGLIAAAGPGRQASRVAAAEVLRNE
jgi:ABC-type antimicrobial peptide transport system permease subunit